MQNIHTFDQLAAEMPNLPEGPRDLNTNIFAGPGEIVCRVVMGGAQLCKILAILAVDFNGKTRMAATFNGHQWNEGIRSKNNFRDLTFIDPPLQGQHSGYPNMPVDKGIQILRLRYPRHINKGRVFISETYNKGIWSPFEISADNLAETVNADLPLLMRAMAGLKEARVQIQNQIKELVAYKAPHIPFQKKEYVPKVRVTPPAPRKDNRQAMADLAAMDNMATAPAMTSDPEPAWEPELAGVLASASSTIYDDDEL